MEDFEFRQPEEKDEQAHRDFIREFVDAGEEITPGSVSLGGFNYTEWLTKKRNNAQGVNLQEGKVPATTYFLIRKSDHKIVGATNIRHELNDYLLRFAGHIGYGVVSSERRKGYASMMLQKALKICKEMNMSKVLITCSKDNIASANTIRKNGGVLENEVVSEDGKIGQRYWINIQ